MLGHYLIDVRKPIQHPTLLSLDVPSPTAVMAHSTDYTASRLRGLERAISSRDVLFGVMHRWC